MSTFKSLMMEKLQENGLFEEQAATVILAAMKHDSLDNMMGRWNNDPSGYPAGLVNIVWSLVRKVAYEWICINAPQAWFRPAFAPGADTAEDPEAFVDNYLKQLNAGVQAIDPVMREHLKSVKHLDTNSTPLYNPHSHAELTEQCRAQSPYPQKPDNG